MISRRELEVLILERIAELQRVESDLCRRYRQLTATGTRARGQFLRFKADLDARVVELEQLVSALGSSQSNIGPIAA